MPLAGSLEVLKSQKFDKLLEKLEILNKIFDIFEAGGTTKYLEDFWSRGPCLRTDFPRDLSLFDWLFDGAPKPRMENQNLAEFID